MANISKEAPVATVINIFTVAPEKQAQLAAMLADTTQGTVKQLPGFVSASIHRSADGTRVANYAQWQSRKAFEAALKNPDFLAHIEPITKIAEADAHVYEVVETASGAGGETQPVAVPDLTARPHQLVVERTMNAPRDVLYRAWTQQMDRCDVDQCRHRRRGDRRHGRAQPGSQAHSAAAHTRRFPRRRVHAPA